MKKPLIRTSSSAIAEVSSKRVPATKTQRSLLLQLVGLLMLLSGVTALVYDAFVLPTRPQIRDAMEMLPLPIALQVLLFALSGFMTIVVGRGILDGSNWARWTYLIWNSLGVLVALPMWCSNPRMFAIGSPGLLVFFLLVYFLFRKSASAHFAPLETSHCKKKATRLFLGIPSCLIFLLVVNFLSWESHLHQPKPFGSFPNQYKMLK